MSLPLNYTMFGTPSPFKLMGKPTLHNLGGSADALLSHAKYCVKDLVKN